MKSFNIPMLVTSLLGFCFLPSPCVPSACADFTFGEPVNVKQQEIFACFSYDGLEAYVVSVRPGGQGDYDLCVVRRATTDSDWGPPENLGPLVNSTYDGGLTSISADGLTLYFNSTQTGGYGRDDLWMTTRPTKNDPWGQAVNLGPNINTSKMDVDPAISPDDLELYFRRGAGSQFGFADIFVAKRATPNDPWGQAVNLGPVVNNPDGYSEEYISLSPDGLLLLFMCDYWGKRPGATTPNEIWMSRRASTSDPWQPPVNLGPQLNRFGHTMFARILPDGFTLFFRATDQAGVRDQWQAPIIPIVDFNADEVVDLVDLVMLIDNWGTDNTLCDIGPFAWGDGVVDIEDLKVFISYWEQSNGPLTGENLENSQDGQ